VPTRNQAESRKRIDSHRVRAETVDLTHGAGGAALGDEITDAFAQPGKVRVRDRDADGDGDCFLLGHPYG